MHEPPRGASVPRQRELSHHSVQPERRLGAQPGEVVVAVDHHPHHRGVILETHRAQTALAQPGDRGGERVVRVVLRCLRRTQQPNPG